MSRQACVLYAGVNEPLRQTAELFERPLTLQSALISGCKNCAPAHIEGEQSVFAPGWNAHLTCSGAEGRTITHVGIRAHFITPGVSGMENALLCRVVDAADDVFSRVLTLLPAGGTGTIRAELSRADGARFVAGSEGWFCLPKHAVMLLSESPEI